MAASPNANLLDAPEERILIIDRVFDAPVALVYKAWTDPEYLMGWWGPGGWNAVSCTAEVRVGGPWRHRFESPDGKGYTHGGVYKEVVPEKRLVFTHNWFYDDGRVSIDTVVTVTFRAKGAKTELTFRQELFDTRENRDNHNGGWSGSLDDLARFLADHTANAGKGDAR